jgi:hypothetical protein
METALVAALTGATLLAAGCGGARVTIRPLLPDEPGCAALTH